MLLAPRKFAFLALAGLALAAAGCGKSNNEGKIVGKWKLVSAPGIKEEELKMLEAFGGSLVFDFRADGTVVTGLEVTDPELKKAIAAKGEPTSMSGKYKLLSGDSVEFTGLSGEKAGGGLFGKGDKSRATVTVNGDQMTVTGSDGVGTFTKVK